MNHDAFVSEGYGEKPYLSNMTLKDARTFFSARCQMLPTVKMNFKHKPEYIASDHLCACGLPDAQAHLVECASYSHLREGLRVTECDKDLVRFFQLVIQERQENANSD